MAIHPTPFIRVSINRYGFSALDVRINIIGTDDTKTVAVNLLSTMTKASSYEDLDRLGQQYDLACKKYGVNKDDGGTQFHVGDDLVSIIRYDEATIY